MLCPDALVGKDNPVRIIDMFVQLMDLGSLGFTKTRLSKEGGCPYGAKHLLKLFTMDITFLEQSNQAGDTLTPW